VSKVNSFEDEAGRAAALAVIGAYGADSARWPVETRAAVLALAAHDAVVADALADARRLDEALRGWAGDVPVRRFEVEALIPAARVASPAPGGAFGGLRGGALRWLGGGAIAASVAAALLLGVSGPQGTGTGMGPGAGFEVASGGGDISHQVSLGSASEQSEPLEGFALVFTPTAYEEDLI
jgi:hypothetical protein